jgi:hypothetical protein
MVKDTVLSIRTTPEIKAAIDKAAADDRRPMAQFVELVLVRWLEQHDYLPAAKGGKRQK